jgi:hypothetical protein
LKVPFSLPQPEWSEQQIGLIRPASGNLGKIGEKNPTPIFGLFPKKIPNSGLAKAGKISVELSQHTAGFSHGNGSFALFRWLILRGIGKSSTASTTPFIGLPERQRYPSIRFLYHAENSAEDD